MVISALNQQLDRLQYTSTLAPDQGAITVDTIYPASEKHISKHTSQKFLMVSRLHSCIKSKEVALCANYGKVCTCITHFSTGSFATRIKFQAIP